MKKKIVALLAVVLMAGVAYGDVGDSWSLAGDMQNVSNPGPAIDPGAPGGGTGFWIYHSSFVPFSDPAIIANNVNPEVPDAGIGWVNPAANWIMLVKFTVDANPVPPIGTGDDKTNFLAGDVGGHANTGATWVTDHAGTFQIDYLGYNARNPETAAGNEIGRQTTLVLTAAGVELDSQVISNAFESVPGSGVFDIPGQAGSANAYTNSVVVTLAAGESVDLQQLGEDWSGLGMTITEIPEPMTFGLLTAGSLLALRRRRRS